MWAGCEELKIYGMVWQGKAGLARARLGKGGNPHLFKNII